MYTNRTKYSNSNLNKSKDNQLLLNISTKKNNHISGNKLNIEPISLKNYNINYNSDNKRGMFNFIQNFRNSSDDDINDAENDDSENENENENDITFQSMLNDIEIVNSNVMSKINIIVNNKKIKIKMQKIIINLNLSVII